VEIKAYQVKSVFTPMFSFCVRLCLDIDYNNPVVDLRFSFLLCSVWMIRNLIEPSSPAVFYLRR
jgi:hypothetical protein